MYPKKLGISMPFSSTIAFTVKFGPLPMWLFAPMKTAPQLIAARMWFGFTSTREARAHAPRRGTIK